MLFAHNAAQQLLEAVGSSVLAQRDCIGLQSSGYQLVFQVRPESKR